MRLVWRPITKWPGELTPASQRQVAPWRVNEDTLWRDLEREIEALDPVYPEIVLEAACGEGDMTVGGSLQTPGTSPRRSPSHLIPSYSPRA